MRSSTLLSAFLSLRFAFAQDDDSNAGTSLTSPKRGLIYVKTENSKDNHFWTDASDLTWYYNYESTPTSAIDHSQLQFVPMLWGASNNDNFASTVKGLVSNGMNITYVLGFNEPDGCSNGGSCVDTQTAVQMWKDQMEPLGKMGIKLGGPAVTNAETGFEWLQSFFTLCNGECTVDFLPAHYYGNFEGLASHLGRVNATYKNISSTWVTEYGYPNQSLEATQDFYNQSASFLNRVPWIDRYSYFGSFRSDVSNIGPNSAMLTQKGELTDIGAWYLGEDATGNIPKGDARRVAVGAGWVLVVLAAGAMFFG